MVERKKPEIMSAWNFMARFSTDEIAVEHIERMRWGDRPYCPHCNSVRVGEVRNKKPQPYRCKGCHKYSSCKTGTVFHSANLSPPGYRDTIILQQSETDHAT